MDKILLVDDDPEIREFCYSLLVDEGYEVTAVPTGNDVFDFIKKELPDIMIMDLEIPGEEGLSLLRSMPNQENYRIPIVIFSGSVTPSIEKQAIELGAVDVISKGGEPRIFLERVKKVLSRKDRILKERDSEPKSTSTPTSTTESSDEDSSDQPLDEKAEKLLIVDDDENIRSLIQAFFREKGYYTYTVPSGEDAIECLQEKKFDMVLLDVSMRGGMDGIMTLRKIKELHPDIGVVMATGVIDETVAKQATENGAYAYVTKPFDFDYLEKVVLTRLLLSS